MKKRLAILCFLVCFSMFVFAIPGITSQNTNEYGQFIFYRDYTFPTETYIGFVEYSDSVVAIRYYSPKATVGTKDITLYISLNPKADYVDMTGEKIIGDVTNDDVETLNYMHDLLYEFSARRKNATISKQAQRTTIQQDFVQFGGDVSIEFDKFFPVFNINKITSKDGKSLFEAITVGRITPNTTVDNFESLKIFPKYTKPVIIQKAPPKENLVWTPSTTNGLYFLGDSAMLLCYMIKLAPSDLQSLNFKEWFVKSILFPDTSVSEIYLPELKITQKQETCLISSVLFDENNEFINTFDVIQTTDEQDTFLIYHYSVMNDFYIENEAYFSDLLREYQ